MDRSIHVIAVVFDFDDTLTDDSTTTLLEQHGISTQDFWEKDVKQLVLEQEWDSTLAWLHLFFQLIEQGKLPQLTNDDLKQFGKTLKPYPGLSGLLKDLKKVAKSESTDRDSFEVEFYVISGGIQDVIEGFEMRKDFTAVWGCELAAPSGGGGVRYVKRAITFTEKTRYLFEINKGIDYGAAAKNPLLVNKAVLERRIPFENMVYIGDGLTDIPCFSLVQKQSSGIGTAIGVFKPGVDKSARRALLELLNPGRVKMLHAPRYRKKDELGILLRMSVQQRCVDIKRRRAAD